MPIRSQFASISLHLLSHFQGSLIGVCGPVGSGKSLLLMGILGETEKSSSGTIRIVQSTIDDGFAFVPQACWLQRASVRDNILFGRPYCHDFYNQVIAATALQVDLQVCTSKSYGWMLLSCCVSADARW
jgi:ATP-binding cassette subfamily C (CFTR/MRP) protein 10